LNLPTLPSGVADDNGGSWPDYGDTGFGGFGNFVRNGAWSQSPCVFAVSFPLIGIIVLLFIDAI
jgi:hypothetical protein